MRTEPRLRGLCRVQPALDKINRILYYVNAGRADCEEVAIFFSTVSAPMSCAHRLNLQLSVSLLCRLTLAIVLSPVKSSKMILLPPEVATFLERSACTIPTVSALPDFVRPLNLQLSINEPAFCQCRFQRRKAALE